MKQKIYRYSEIFGETFQGEGTHTGKNTIWVRWFGCNKTCYLFGQDKNNIIPKNEMYYEKINAIDIKTLEDAPIHDIGCDSWTSWHPKYRHLSKRNTAIEIAEKLVDLNRNQYNPDGLFIHPRSGQDIHLCFTGGESMMSQDGITEVLQHLFSIGNYPLNVTIETNGSVMLSDDFAIPTGITLFWSSSPKLESVSGEPWGTSICPDVILSYDKFTSNGQLKFVCDNSDASWNEIEKAIDEYRAVGVKWPIWIMPEGATANAQHRHDIDVCEEAIRRGYHFCARVHAMVFGAVPGK